MVFFLALVLDLVSKYLIFILRPNYIGEIIFEIGYYENYSGSIDFYMILQFVIPLILLCLISKKEDYRLIRFGLSLFAAGNSGNFINIIVMSGSCIDWIVINGIAFNIADILILLGFIIITTQIIKWLLSDIIVIKLKGLFKSNK